jgi:hypothetical protein
VRIDETGDAPCCLGGFQVMQGEDPGVTRTMLSGRTGHLEGWNWRFVWSL